MRKKIVKKRKISVKKKKDNLCGPHLDQIILTQSKLVQADFNLDNFMNLVIKKMQKLTPATGAVIELTDGDDMVYRAATGSIKNYVGLHLPISGSISGLCIKQKDILQSDDTENDARVNIEACRKVKARSLIVAPLFYRGDACGVLKVVSQKPNAFSKLDIQTLKLMANLIASGLAQKLFYDALTREKNKTNEFFSIVNHELRTPLTSINGSLVLLLSESLGTLNEKQKDLMGIARKNGERLGRLINDILDIQKLDADKMQFDIKPHNLVTLIDESILANQMYAAKHDVNIISDIKVNDVPVEIDSDRFLQIMANLLSNAIKYSPKNDSVIIKLDQINNKARVSIIDHGPGIPEEFKSRIFQKFSQAEKSQTSGTGLGLNITKTLIEKFGGRINFTSSEKGTIFYFDLPIAK